MVARFAYVIYRPHVFSSPASAQQTYVDTLAVMHAPPSVPFVRFDHQFAHVASGVRDHQEGRYAKVTAETSEPAALFDR